jgi:serine protease Do
MWRIAVAVWLAFAASPVAAENSFKAVAAGSPISVAGKPNLPVVSVSRVTSTIADDERLGEIQRAWTCGSAGTFRWSGKFAEAIEQHIKTALSRELESAGYHVQKKAESAFDTGPVNARADYEIGAVVKNFSLDLCVYVSGALHGSSYINVKWELLNAKAQKVVLSLSTEGSFKREDSEKDSIPEFFDHAIVAAARNLLASKEFVAAVTESAAGAQEATSAPALVLPKASPPPGGTEKNSTQIRAAVVTVETAAGKGSAFYIDRTGYLLTNQHVVGESKFVKVRTATGREIPGEVLRIDTHRDVALLKTEATPFDPLAVRLGGTHIGEDVYSVGSPLGEAFSGSVTKGVISGDRDLDNLRFIQSDVAILPGNSGGPLLDAEGSVIGIAESALDSGRANLNLFVPIDEALRAVSVKVE